jgi:hypothetical protein
MEYYFIYKDYTHRILKHDTKGWNNFHKEYNKKEFEENKGIIRIHKSRRNRHHNGQKKKYKRTNNDLQTYI